MNGDSGRLDVVRIKMSSLMNQAVIWTKIWSTYVPSWAMCVQYSTHDFPSTGWISLLYVAFKFVTESRVELSAKLVTLFLIHCWPLNSAVGLFCFSHSLTSGLLHCWTIEFGKQFHWPSVWLSNLSARLHRWIAAIRPSMVLSSWSI